MGVGAGLDEGKREIAGSRDSGDLRRDLQGIGRAGGRKEMMRGDLGRIWPKKENPFPFLK
jgi:hypothetical protein